MDKELLLSELILKLQEKLSESGDGLIYAENQRGLTNEISHIETDFDYDIGTFYIIKMNETLY